MRLTEAIDYAKRVITRPLVTEVDPDEACIAVLLRALQGCTSSGEQLYEEMDAWRARATRAEGALQLERAEKKLTQDKLAQMVRERDDLQLKMDLGG
jgi:hypothetical protein